MILRGLLIKEWKLIARDLHAMGVLFIMPAAFMLIMSMALSGLDGGEAPSVSLRLDKPADDPDAMFFEAALQAALPDSRLSAPPDRDLPTLTLPSAFTSRVLDTELSLDLVFPATTDRATRQRLRTAVELAVAQTRLHAFFQEVGDMNDAMPLAERLETVRQYTQVDINERDRLLDGGVTQQTGAARHSVPAWLIFGMFFIMLPMANGLLQEQRSGVLARLQSLGLKPRLLLASKLLPYAAINMLQFALLMLLGLYGLPLLGVAPLAPAGSLPAWLLLVSTLVLATCSLGLAVAGVARTAEQAVLISAGLNLILAAIGGIMVPWSVMPELMQHLSRLSPMNWALEAFTLLLAGQGGVADILPWCLYLLLFALLCAGAGLLLFQRRLKVNRWTTMN